MASDLASSTAPLVATARAEGNAELMAVGLVPTSTGRWLPVVALALQAVAPACQPADGPDDDSSGTPIDLDELCTSLQDIDHACGNPECAAYPPCQIPMVRTEEDWPRFTPVEPDAYRVPLALDCAGDQCAYVSTVPTDGTDGWSAIAGMWIPSRPWADGETIVGPDQWIFTLPWWLHMVGAMDPYVVRYGLVRDPSGKGLDHLLGGWLEVDEPAWGSESGYALLIWRADDVEPGSPTEPSVAIGPNSATPSGPVGDVNGQGVADYAVGTTEAAWYYDLSVFAGEGVPPTEGGERLAVLRNEFDALGQYRFDPQPVGDLTGDGVDDLVVAWTFSLTDASEDDRMPLQVLAFSGGEGLSGEIRPEDASVRFVPVGGEYWTQPEEGSTFDPMYFHGPVRVRGGDINGDGLTDVAICARNDPQMDPENPWRSRGSYWSPAVRVFVNPGSWPTDLEPEAGLQLRFPGNSYGGAGQGLLVQDLDGDGLDDVVLPIETGLFVDWMGIGTDKVSLAVWSGRAIADAQPGPELWPSVLLGTRVAEQLGGEGDDIAGEAGEELAFDGEDILMSTGVEGPVEHGVVQVIPPSALAPYL